MKLEEQKTPYDIKQKRMSWQVLALMAFMTVWGFGNIVNGYAFYGGMKVIFTWILMFIIYFIPYSLMVGEMGSAFKTEGGGVSTWIDKTFNTKLAYYAGWTYWVVHLPYISQKPLNIIVATSWAIWGDKRVSDFNIIYVQLIAIAIFLLVVFLASRGITMVKRICSIAGMAGLVMSLLFILMAVSAAKFMPVSAHKVDFSFSNLMPTFNFKYLTNIGILVFALGGCEKISPYVNKVKEPGKGFPRGIIFMVVMVVITAILGTIALALMFDPSQATKDLVTNGAYIAFQRLGDWYGVGNLFMQLYALTILISNFGVMILSIDAPLRILLETTNEKFIPSSLKKLNQYGAYKNGIRLITIVGLILLVVPLFGIDDVQAMVKYLIELNAVCMPMRYVWVFLAYIGLKRLTNIKAEYIFTKNPLAGKFFGWWCLLLTIGACAFKTYNEDPFRMALNWITPLVLLGLGLIMPVLAKKEREQNKSN